MANLYEFSQPFKPSEATLLDSRGVVNTFEDITKITNPSIGLLIYVKDEATFYKVISVSPRTTEMGAVEYYIHPDKNIVKVLEKGDKGADGAAGPMGPQGPKGDPGDVAVGSFTAMIFKTSTTKPNKPSGGTWDSVTNTFTPPSGWKNSSNGLTRPVWMSTKIFYTDSSLNGDWSTPIQISGDDGQKGADGATTEFLFKLSKTYNLKPTIPSNQLDWDPEEDDEWTDDPTGIDETYQCEWVITRYVEDDGSWSDWKGPTLWAKWGEVGQDGAGVEYVYYLNNGYIPSSPTPYDYETNEDYQNPDKEYEPTDTKWKDEPVGVSSVETHEWVCVRKYRNGKWGPYSPPALWSHYGEGARGADGYSVRTLYATTDSTSERPSFSEYDSVSGMLNRGWKMSFPIDYDLDTIVWATDGYLDISGNLVGVWSQPRLIVGIKGSMDIPMYYSSNYYTIPNSEGAVPYPPTVGISADSTITSQDSAGGICTWLDAPNDSSKQWYQCVAKINTATNLIESWGAVATWNGKDGDAKDGKHWEIRIAIISDKDFDGPYINKNSTNPNEGVSGAPWKEVTTNTDLTVLEGQRMWETKAEFNADGSFASGGWCNPYPITGERGPQGETGPAGKDGANGTSGVAGISYEERYMIGTIDGPELEWDDSQRLNRTPENGDWGLSIPKVTNDNPYIWCIKGRINYLGQLEDDGWEGPFRLSGVNGINGISATPTTIGVLTNPGDTIVCDAEGSIINGLPLETTLKIYDGEGEKKVLSSSFGYEIVTEFNPSLITISSDAQTATIKITAVDPAAPRNIRIKIKGKWKQDGIEYYQIYSLKKLFTTDLPIQADLSNDSVTLPATPSGELLYDEIDNTFNMYIGTNSVTMSNIYLSNESKQLTSYTGITSDFTKDATGNYTGKFKLTLDDTAFKTDVLIIYITGVCKDPNTGDEHSKIVPLRVTRLRNGENSTWYELWTSHGAIVRDKLNDGTLTKDFYPLSISIGLKKHVGKEVTGITVEDAIKNEGLKIQVQVDDESNLFDLTKTSLELNTFADLEERLVFILRDENDNFLDRENIPVVTNGIGATSYKLVASHDVISYNEEGKITNIEPSTDGNYRVSAYVIVQEPKKDPIVVNNYGLQQTYLNGFNLVYSVDGGTEKLYIPGMSIPVTNVKENIVFKLRYVLTEPDFIWDHETVRVVRNNPGIRGQMVYPAGIYNVDATYTTTHTKAPYVLDTSTGKYYVLNAITSWTGSEQPDGYNTPSANYNNNQGHDVVWEPFEMFEAIYSDIGILKQAYVGSAVFYDKYIFSQQGIDKNGNIDTNVENFMLTETGETATHPYAGNALFRPNFCINCETGEVAFGQGKFVVHSDGTIFIGRRSDAGAPDKNGRANTIFRPNGAGWINDGLITWTDKGLVKLANGLITATIADDTIADVTLGDFKYDKNTNTLSYDNGDGSRFSIGKNGIHYSNSDDNSYFHISSDGTAEFARGQVKFNSDGSGQININADGKATLKWDLDGNITQCNLYDQERIGDEYEYQCDLRPHTTKYLLCTGVDSDFRLKMPKRTYRGDDILLGEYYGSIIVLNAQSSPIRVYIQDDSTDQHFPYYADLDPRGSIKINYFTSPYEEAEVYGYIEGNYSLIGLTPTS